MASNPSIAIFVYAGATSPVVLSTAVSRFESNLLDEWLSGHPALASLVWDAFAMVDADGSAPPIEGLA